MRIDPSIRPANSISFLRERGIDPLEGMTEVSYAEIMEKAAEKAASCRTSDIFRQRGSFSSDREWYLACLADYKANPQNYKHPIADFSSMRELVLTGNEAMDRSILTGFEYQKSCLDTTNAKDYLSLTENEDFTGMTREEIYKAIYEKFQHCYGEHFLDICAVDFIRPPEPDDDKYREIVSRFENEVLKACGTDDETILFGLRRNSLYPDMTDEEIRQTIIDSYIDRLGYDMTNADICKMAEEISLCGVGHGVRNMFNTHSNPEIYGSRDELLDTARQSAWLSQKVSKRTFDQVYDTYKDKIYFGASVDPEVGGVILQMKEALFPQITFYR